MRTNRKAAGAQDGSIFILEGTETVAIVPASTRDKTKRAAEIVALPKLLALCERMMEMMEEDHAEEIENDHYGDDSCSYCDWMDGAQKSLAEAKGETS